MPNIWDIMSRWKCLPVVVGRPRSKAELVSTALCRLKWMCVAGIGIEILGLLAMVTSSASRAAMPGYPWFFLITHAMPILAMLAFLHLTSRPLTIPQAQNLQIFLAAVVIICNAIMVGIMQLIPVIVPSYCIALFMVYICSTLSVRFMTALLAVSLGAAYVSAILAGVVHQTGWLYQLNSVLVDRSERDSSLTLLLSAACLLLPPIFTGVFAIVMNMWAKQAVRASQLARKTIERQSKWLALEKQKYERLLDRALTAPVARRIRETGSFPPSTRDLCVVVCDVVGFTDYCQRMPAQMIVAELYRFFSVFDKCCQRYGIEPLRSQGDCRLALAGLTESQEQLHGDTRLVTVDTILAMLDFRRKLRAVDSMMEEGQPLFQAHIGIHSGPVMMGVMDGVRMSFDVWGDTVNRAARLQQGAGVNQILVSEHVLWACRGLFEHSEVKAVHVKNLEVPAAAEIYKIKAEYQDEQGEPNAAFWRTYRAKDITVRPAKEGDSSASLRITAGRSAV